MFFLEKWFFSVCNVSKDMSDVLPLDKLKEIDATAKLTVHGFVRSIQASLPETSAFYNIPPSICNIILIYYYLTDEFEIVSDRIQIHNNGKSIKMLDDAYLYIWSSAFGSLAIDSDSEMHFYWKIQCVKRTDTSFIGITNHRMLKEENNVWQYNREPNRIMYCLFSEGQIRSYDNENFKEQKCGTGRQYGEGDIITIDLDLENKEIRYTVNDLSVIPYHRSIETGENIKYYLAIAMLHAGHEMRIVDFVQY